MSENQTNFLKRFDKAKSKDAHYDSIYKEAYHWFQPDRELYSVSSEGAKLRQHIFDNTGGDSLNKFASRVKQLVAPLGKTWMYFKLNKITETALKQTNQNKEYKEINNLLKNISDKIFEYLNNSNFYVSLDEALKDYGIGTGALVINEVDDENSPFTFTAIHPSKIFIEESIDNLPRTVFRELNIQASLIKELYPNAKLTEELKNKIEKEPTSTIEIKEGVLYNPESLKLDEPKPPYSFEVYFKQHKIYEELYTSSPYLVFRFNKNSNEVKGRGPALECVDDLKTLNAAVKGMIKAAEKSVSEIWVMNNSNALNPEIQGKSTDGKLQLEDDSLIVLNDIEGIKRLPFDGSSSVMNDTLVNRLQFEIKNRLLAGTVERSDSITRSPDELNIIVNERAEDLNSMFARLDLEMLRPLFFRLFDVLVKRGIFTQEIQALSQFNISLNNIVLSYNSPIAKVGDFEEIQKFQQSASIILNTMGEQALFDTFNFNKISHDICDKIGIDNSWYRSVSEMEKAQEQRQQQMEAAQQQQQEGGDQ